MSVPSLQISLYLIANECMKRRLIYRPESRHEYWRYFTYMLLHADEWHLTINMCLQVRMSTALPPKCTCLLTLVCFAVLCRCLAGTGAGSLPSGPSLHCGRHLRCTGQCLAAAGAVVGGRLGGRLCHAVQSCAAPGFGQSSVAASSSATAISNFRFVFLFLFFSILHFQNFSQLSHRFVRIAVILILLACDVAFTTFHFCVNHNRNPRISLEAHFGGIVAGLLCGFMAYRRLPTTTTTATTATRKQRAWYF